jgi:hypothetical protein
VSPIDPCIWEQPLRNTCTISTSIGAATVSKSEIAVATSQTDSVETSKHTGQHLHRIARSETLCQVQGAGGGWGRRLRRCPDASKLGSLHPLESISTTLNELRMQKKLPCKCFPLMGSRWPHTIAKGPREVFCFGVGRNVWRTAVDHRALQRQK